MARKQKATRVEKAVPRAQLPPIYYRLHSLLETIRVIKGFEDPLCTLLHAVQTTGTASTEVDAELHELLDAMPSSAYSLERDSVLDLLGASGDRPETAEATGEAHAAATPPRRLAKRTPAKK